VKGIVSKYYASTNEPQIRQLYRFQSALPQRLTIFERSSTVTVYSFFATFRSSQLSDLRTNSDTFDSSKSLLALTLYISSFYQKGRPFNYSKFRI